MIPKDVNKEMQEILNGREGQVYEFKNLLAWMPQNYMLVDVNMQVQKPSFLSFIKLCLQLHNPTTPAA